MAILPFQLGLVRSSHVLGYSLGLDQVRVDRRRLRVDAVGHPHGFGVLEVVRVLRRDTWRVCLQEAIGDQAHIDVLVALDDVPVHLAGFAFLVHDLFEFSLV
jgi:hypothetical protein